MSTVSFAEVKSLRIYALRVWFLPHLVPTLLIMRAQCQTFGNVYVATLYFSCRKDVSRRKMWKVRGRMLRAKGSSGRLPGDSFCPRRPSRQLRLRGQNLKERPTIISFPLLIRLQPVQQRPPRPINRKDNYCEWKISPIYSRQSRNANDASGLQNVSAFNSADVVLLRDRNARKGYARNVYLFNQIRLRASRECILLSNFNIDCTLV